MEHYPIAHYRKNGSSMLVNGGRLTITDTVYIIEYLKKEVARFSVNDTTVSKAPSELLYEGICLSSDSQSIELYFPKGSKAAKALQRLISL